MKFSQLLLTILLSALVALGVAHVAGGTGGVHKESAYERVMRTGTIRCAWVTIPDYMEKDLQTGKFKGYYYELMEEIGKRLSLKIDWAEEVGFANAFDGLKSDRYDVVCIPFSHAPGRARVTAFTAPFVYAPYVAYVRADDTRFDNKAQAMNDPSVKLVVLEGELSQTVKDEDFPKAKILSMPNMTDVTQVLLQVSMGKADVAMTEPYAADLFMAKNPGKIKRIEGPPLRFQPEGLSVGVGEEALKDLLDTAIETLHLTGFVKRTLLKNPTAARHLYLPAAPWGEKVVETKGQTP